MLMWILLATGWAIGVPPLVIGAGALMVVNVPLGLGAIGIAWFIMARMKHRSRKVDEAGFLRTIATAVAAGSTLRSAIRDGDRLIVTSRTRRLCDAGVSMARIGSSLEPALDHNGATLAAVCSLSERTGGTIAPTLHVLADRAADVAALERHRGVATAQARFSALVVGLVPLAVTGGLVIMRGVPGDGSPISLASIVIGSALQVAGVAVVFVLASRSVA